MALTSTQQISKLFKKLLNKSETTTGRTFFEEPFNTYNYVPITSIWLDYNLIPATAPGASVGVVQYITGLTLTAVAGAPNSFYDTTNTLEDIIPFNFGDGTSYNYLIKDSTETQIVFGQGDWLLDTESGILTFYGTIPPNMPPKISFYKYVGARTVSTLNITANSVDDYTSTYPLNAYSKNISFIVTFLSGNTSTNVTFDINGLGAYDIKKYDDGTESYVNLSVGDIKSNKIYFLTFDGSQFIIIGFGGGGSGTNGTSGSSGISGIDGTSGSSGIDGTSGSSGIDGTSGSSGIDGTSGSSGIDGTSGSSGSSGIGTDGTSGSSGIDGTSGSSGSSGIGTNGTSGSSGISGTDGTSGSSGISGTDGTSGSSGISGTDGTSGSSGISGTDGTSGSSGSSGINGIDGGMYFAPNTGLMYYPGTSSGETIYNTLLDPTLTVPATVGGIVIGTTVASLTGKTLVGIIDDLLFPTQLPTYTIPTLGLNNISNTYEAGRVLTFSLTISGIKNDAAAFTNLSITRSYNGGGATTLGSTASPTVTSATNIGNQYGYADPNNPNYNYAYSYSDSSVTIPSPASTSASSIVYNGTSSYGAGLAKKNNKGVDDSRTPAVRSTGAPQLGSSSLAPSNQTISGWFPYFYGISASSLTPAQVVTIIQSGSGFSKVVATGSGTLSMVFNATGQWPWFAIYSPFTTKTTWFENALNQGSIGGATDLFSAPTTSSVNSFDGYWSGINFKIYVAQKVTTIGTCQIS